MPEFVVKDWKERVLIQDYTCHALNAKTLTERKKEAVILPVLAVVPSSFVEVEGWQKQEKGAVQDRRRP